MTGAWIRPGEISCGCDAFSIEVTNHYSALGDPKGLALLALLEKGWRITHRNILDRRGQIMMCGRHHDLRPLMKFWISGVDCGPLYEELATSHFRQHLSALYAEIFDIPPELIEAIYRNGLLEAKSSSPKSFELGLSAKGYQKWHALPAISRAQGRMAARALLLKVRTTWRFRREIFRLDSQVKAAGHA